MLQHHLEQLEYASTQPWFPAFVHNLKTTTGSWNIDANDSIVNAFSWSESKEGPKFWSSIDDYLIYTFVDKITQSTSILAKIEELYPKEEYPELYI